MRVHFWGCDSSQVLSDAKDRSDGREAFSSSFPVHCEAVDFFHYLLDGHYLYFEVCDLSRLEPIGFCIVDTTKDVDLPDENGISPLCKSSHANTVWEDECYVDMYDYKDGTMIGQVHIFMSLLSVL